MTYHINKWQLHSATTRPSRIYWNYSDFVMRTVTIKPNVREELEAVLPIDRVVTIDERGYVSLSDTEFYILEEEIDG